MSRDEDLDAYAAMCADPEVMRFIAAAAWLRDLGGGRARERRARRPHRVPLSRGLAGLRGRLGARARRVGQRLRDRRRATRVAVRVHGARPRARDQLDSSRERRTLETSYLRAVVRVW